MTVGDQVPWGGVIEREVFIDGVLVEVEVRAPDGTLERTYAAPPLD